MKIILTQDMIQARLCEMASEINAFYEGKDLLAVVLMNGGMFFAADLLRLIKIPLKMDSLALASYKNDRSSGIVEFRSKVKLDCKGADVLILDDILDTGLTLKKATEYYKDNGANSVRTCVLLDKMIPAEKRVFPNADWHGFKIENRYVIGFGLDSNELHRNLPYITEMKNENEK